jgi:hypothetical protein
MRFAPVVSVLAWCCAVLPLASAQDMAGSAAPAQTRAGTFKQVEGEVWVGRGGQRRAIGSGDGVGEADRISSGPAGAATITLKDGTVLTMGPKTTMDLNRFQFDATTQKGNFALDLLQGSVRVVTGLLARINPDLFRISTPTSVVGVRGTDFIVETEAAQ